MTQQCLCFVVEQKHNVSIRLLQEWNEDLNDEESEMYKELKIDVEESVSNEFSLQSNLPFSLFVFV